MFSREFVSAIQVPFILELGNKIISSLLIRYPLGGNQLSWAYASTAFTVVILFYLGWRVSVIYTERKLLKSAALGLFLWFFFMLIITGVFGFLYSAIINEPDYLALKGSLFTFFIFSPVAVVVPMVGVFIRNQLHNG